MSSHRGSAQLQANGAHCVLFACSHLAAGELCRKHNVLLLVDTVCSLGGVPLYADAWKVRVMERGGAGAGLGWAGEALWLTVGCSSLGWVAAAAIDGT